MNEWKRSGLCMLAAAIVTALWTLPAPAVDVWQLSTQEKAATRATHVIRITHEDLTTATTNTAQTLTNIAVSAKMGVSAVKLVLEDAFDDGDTNYTGSTSITMGDGGDVDRYITATELNEAGTEVFLKYGTTTENVYTTADTVDCIFTPGSAESVSALTSGAVRIYFRLDDARVGHGF